MDRVYFTINGRKYSGGWLEAFQYLVAAKNKQNIHEIHRHIVTSSAAILAGSEITVDTSLNEFIRRYAEQRGTKYMCLEGGCGVCVVNVRMPHPVTGEIVTFAVNSCLVAIMSCDGWDITTIEGIGNRKIGYNIIQKRLNHFFGSQCGYCSPGFVMSMYSLVQSTDKDLTEAEIENSLGSNLCRCTGYRPILEAFKSLAVHPDQSILRKIKDIEDIDGSICPKSGKSCADVCKNNAYYLDWCLLNIKSMNVHSALPRKTLLSDGRLWSAVNDIKTIFNILDEVGYDNYMLVAGNTSRGVRPIRFYPKIIIDITNITVLRTHYVDVNLVLGANITLTETMKLFHELSEANGDFWYLKIFRYHLDRVAHIPVRNIGTLAGNLVLKHEHPDFQSDVFLLFDCVGATITLVDRDNMQTEISLNEYLKINLVGKVITQIKLPPLSRHHHELVTYKITPREQNAQAEVNSAFLFKFDTISGNILKASIVYGNINPSFTHAYETEKFLIGRNIFKNDVLQATLQCLQKEINPEFNPPEPSPFYRRKLALSLFYKAILKLCPRDILNPFYKSGATTPTEDRPPVSRSYQEYDTDKAEYPITQPLLKKEGMIQCAGEAVYSDDIPGIKDEVFASFVLATVAKADIESIDDSEAMKIDGVFAVLTSADIPGVNSIVRPDNALIHENEELLASKKVRFYNQPVAIAVAKTQMLAEQASYLVKINYKNISKKPIVFTIEDAIKAPKEENRVVRYPGMQPKDRGTDIKKIIKGRFCSPRQYHFTTELQTSITQPVDNELEVNCSTQWMDMTQAAIAQLLNIPENAIIIKTRRCGGGFGCKISRVNFAACATALVAKKLNKACRMSMHMTDIMRAIGKRPNAIFDYKIGVDDNGRIQYLDGMFYINDALSSNENENLLAIDGVKNCYDSNRWKIDSFAVMTDAPTNCSMRAPGDFEAIAAIEHVMEHIAVAVNKDPVTVRMVNYRIEDNPLPELVPMFIEKTEYRKRQDSIKKFNAYNRWKKRAIKFTNMAFRVIYYGNFSALVSVYHGDGSVVINIGGIEIGQGIYTRMAQVAANELLIPVDKVTVLPSINFVTPNNFTTGGSITTERCANAVIRSCDQINARLAPVRAAMPNATWEQIVFEANRLGILLQANYQSSNDIPLPLYLVFGVASTEVEIDVLTGRKMIIRADVLEDAGHSINPALDVGQVEGAFIQSLSLWTIEDTKYNERTGEIYTDRTWNYKIMGAKDIPYDFRVYLRQGANNPVGVLGSKAVGEPPICMGHVVVDALRDAIQASRSDSGYDTHSFLDIDVPIMNEVILKAADVRIEEYILY